MKEIRYVVWLQMDHCCVLGEHYFTLLYPAFRHEYCQAVQFLKIAIAVPEETFRISDLKEKNSSRTCVLLKKEY